MRNLLIAGFSLFILCFIPKNVDGAQFYLGTNLGVFGVVDTTTGIFSQLGSFNRPLWGLSLGPDGSYFGNDVPIGGTSWITTFYKVLPASVQRTPVGPVNTENLVYFGSAFLGSTLYEIEVDVSSFRPYLVTVDTSDGHPTIVAQFNLTTEGALITDRQKNMFLTRGLFSPGFYAVDPATAICTQISADAHMGIVYCLAYDNGVLYAVNNMRSIFTVNTATGLGTLIGNIDSDIGSPFVMAPVSEPTTGPYMFALTSFLLVCRRRRISGSNVWLCTTK